MDDLGYARSRVAELGERFCLTFVKGVDEREALARMGAYPDTVGERAAEELAGHAAALTVGRWTLVVEPGGAAGSDHVLLEAVSRGTEAVSVLRDDAATPRFTYATKGTTAVAFDPSFPSPEVMWGSDAGLLQHLMQAVGLREPAGEDEETWRDAEAKSLVLAQRITGVRVPEDALAGPRLSARIEPWFVGGPRPADLLRPGPRFAGLFAAAQAAPDERKRAVAVGEVRRLAGLLGVSDTPGLAAALDEAARGTGRPVPMDSELGRHVRTWLAASGADGLGLLTTALRGVLDRDADVALRAALRPLRAGGSLFDPEPAREAVTAALQTP